MTDDALAYLVCNPFPPVPLREGAAKRTIGRTDDNDVVLPHDAVSRVHAVVWVEGGEVHFEDRSSNGSLVNGSRLKGKTALKVGDTVAIGPYDIELVKTIDPVTMRLSQRTKEIDWSDMVTGLLEETPLLETFQLLEFGSRTGTLKVTSDGGKGEFVINQGQPWSGVFGDLKDRDAVMAMLSLKKGRYTFSPSDVSGERTLQGSITGLLLDFSRLGDEHQRTMRHDKVAE